MAVSPYPPHWAGLGLVLYSKKVNKLKFNIKIAGVGVCLFLLFYIGSPFYVVYQINQGIIQRDAELISSYIDYEKLRASISTQAKIQLIKNIKQTENPLEALSLAFASGIAEGTLNTLVSFEGLAAMLKEYPPTDDGYPTLSFPQYQDRDRTQVHLGQGSQKITLVLERDNLFSWKLTRIKSPTEYSATEVNELLTKKLGDKPQNTAHKTPSEKVTNRNKTQPENVVPKNEHDFFTALDFVETMESKQTNKNNE